MFHRKITVGTIAVLAVTTVAQYRDRAAIIPVVKDTATHVDSRNG